MKHILLVGLITGLLAFNSFGQNKQYAYEDLYLPRINDKVTYQDVVDIPGKTQKEIHNALRIWFLETFKNSEKVIELDDKENGIIAGNGVFRIYAKYMTAITSQYVNFSLRFDIKDEKFRYTISNIIMESETVRYRNPIETFFSYEWMFKENGKPRKLNLDFYIEFEDQIILLEQAILGAVNTYIKDQDW
jgi:hypothetical protein